MRFVPEHRRTASQQAERVSESTRGEPRSLGRDEGLPAPTHPRAGFRCRCPVCKGRGICNDPTYDPAGLEPWECDECEGHGWITGDAA